MCIMEVVSWLLYFVLAIFVFLSSYFLVCAYLFPFLLFSQYALLIWMIPLNLNWSRGLYSRLFWKSVFLFCVTILSFSLVYRFYGIIDTASGEITKRYLTSLYFSITTWSTLGYGDFRPVAEVRLLTSFEAILGVLSIPLIFTMIWKYCDFRILETSEENKHKERRKLKVVLDDHGYWKQIDNNGQILDIKQKYYLNPCCKCGNSELRVERYFDLIGVVSPRMQFMVHCTCGHCVSGKYLAMTAARDWNKKNKIKNG